MRVHKRPVHPIASKTVKRRAVAEPTTEKRVKADAFVGTHTPAPVATVLNAAGRTDRSDGPEGHERLLNPHERARVKALMTSSSPAVVKHLEALTDGLSTVGAALVYRAAAARTGQLDVGSDAMHTLAEFAHRVRGMTDAQLLQNATSLDLDSRVNSSTTDLMPLWHRRGVVHAPTANTDTADNDGLAQRFTATCGTTVLQMMLAEADPVFALSLHDAGLSTDATTGPIAKFQADLLNKMGGVAIGRVEATLRSRLHNALGRLESRGEITSAGKRALLAHALKHAPLTATAERALKTVRAADEGFPSEAELTRLRAQRLPDKDEGLGSAEFLQLIQKLYTPMTGVTYAWTHPEDGFARGGVGRHLDEVEAALKRGIDVPFGINEPAHWMLMTAVEGRAPNRRFLVSDPDGGRTAWVTEKDVLSGVFGDKQFHLSETHERPYIDSFALPTS